MLDYDAFNREVYARIPNHALNILDIGCGTGVLGRALKDDVKERKVTGVTYSHQECDIAAQALDKVYVADLNQNMPALPDKYDCIILSHILEHTYQPAEVLKKVAVYLKVDGVVIIALPNVLQFKQRFQFLKGHFKYSANGGLMDDTHFRFFDWRTAQQLVADAGLHIIEKESTGNFPLAFVRKGLPLLAKKLDGIALRYWPGLFGFQFVFTAVRPYQSI